MQVARVSRSAFASALRAPIGFQATRSYSNHKSIDASAQAAYEKNPQSFLNFPLDKITFAPEVIEGKKLVVPRVYFDGVKQVSGIVHITPFSKILFPKVGGNGNFGMKRGYVAGTVDTVQETEQSLTLTNRSIDGDGLNVHVQNYFAWITAIEDKLIDHLLEHSTEYTSLKKKFGSTLSLNPSVAKDILSSGFTRSIRKSKAPEAGSPSRYYDPEEQLFAIRQKLYGKQANDKKGPIFTELDQKADQEGLSRRHIPIYDAYGNELPVETTLKNFDIVSAQVLLSSNLYEIGSNVGFGFRKTIRSIVYLRGNEISAGNKKGAPLAISPLQE